MMNPQYNLLVIVAIALIAGVSYARSPQKIINGQSATRGEFKYHAELDLNTINVCGGAIIDNRHVITAAHCICGKTEHPYYNLKVLTGEARVYYGESHQVKTIECHPQFVNRLSSAAYDIAIIALKTNITFNDYQDKVELPNGPTAGDLVANFTGWGAVTFRPSGYPDILQKISVTTLSNSECQLYPKRSNINTREMCVRYAQEAGSCGGDSGGPVVRDGTLIGINSWGPTYCTAERPHVCTRVYEFVDWIRAVVSRT